jgi:hypothetical protein
VNLLDDNPEITSEKQLIDAYTALHYVRKYITES